MTRWERIIGVSLSVGALIGLAGLTWHHMAILGDGFWTIATGRWLIAHRELPRSDPFAYGSTGDWMIVSSGACLLFSAITNAVGLRGLMAVAAAVEVLAVWLVWTRSARTTFARLLLLPLALFYIEVDAQDLSARGQIFGDLALVLLLGALGRIRDGKRVHPALIFVLAAVWTNVHLSFLAAIVLPGLCAVLALFDRTTRPVARKYLALAALAAAAACVNPYGPAYFRLALGTAFDSSTATLDLFKSPDFHDPRWLLAPAVAIAILIALGRRSPWSIAERAFLLALIAASCKSRRFATALIAVEIALAGPLLDAAWARLSSRWLRPGLAVTGAIAVAAGVFGASALRADGFTRKNPLRDVPVAAARVLSAGERPVAPLHWGGYLAYEWMGTPRYFIDGRDHLALFGNGAFDDSTAMWNGAPNALDLLDVYEAGAVLWESGQPLDEMLSRDPQWRIAYRDEMAVVYLRTPQTP